MGRLVRRYIRVYNLTIANQSYVNKVQAIDETVNLRPLRSGITINDGVTLTGFAYGAHIEIDVEGTGQITGVVNGIRLEMSSAIGTTTTTSFQGIWISNYNLGTQSANNYHMLRMQENGTYTIETMFYLRGGTGGVNYFAVLHGEQDAWHATQNPTVPSGWIRLMAGGLVRWLQLYSVAPP